MHYASRSLLQPARDLCTALYTVRGPDALWLADVVRMEKSDIIAERARTSTIYRNDVSHRKCHPSIPINSLSLTCTEHLTRPHEHEHET
ncbi:hypothetical protein VI817_003141 [Penicillium citrinum]|nr:hypothetical protein VI817_003141 [Penicillium citrinum]